MKLLAAHFTVLAHPQTLRRLSSQLLCPFMSLFFRPHEKLMVPVLEIRQYWGLLLAFIDTLQF
jgi:hypothetical protein